MQPVKIKRNDASRRKEGSKPEKGGRSSWLFLRKRKIREYKNVYITVNYEALTVGQMV